MQIGLCLLDPGLFDAVLINGLLEVLRVDLCTFFPLEVFVVGQEHESESSDDESCEIFLVVNRLARFLWLLFIGLFEEV